MLCPFCKAPDTSVKDSRLSDEGLVVRRRRKCGKCDAKFTTFERVQHKKLIVTKRSGLKRQFDRNKIVNSLIAATRKCNISINTIEEIADKLVFTLEQSNLKEIPTRKIGELIMDELAKIDQVAYVRFASVYKDFNSASDFMRFIKSIKK